MIIGDEDMSIFHIWNPPWEKKLLSILDWVLINCWCIITEILLRIKKFLVIWYCTLIFWHNITGIIHWIITSFSICNFLLVICRALIPNNRGHIFIFINKKVTIIQAKNRLPYDPYQILLWNWSETLNCSI